MARSDSGDKARFARRVRELREARGWSRQELAKMLDVKVATIVNWEKAQHFVTMHLRDRLCELFGTDSKDLGLPPYNLELDDPD